MEAKRSELITILEATRPGLAKGNVSEQAGHFVFIGDAVTTYNERICVHHPIPFTLHCSVSADTLLKTLKGMDASEELLDIVEEEGLLKITSFVDKRGQLKPKTKANIATNRADFFVEESVKQLNLQSLDKWKPMPAEFLSGLEQVLFSVSRDATAGALTSISIRGTDITSSDDRRVSLYTMASRMPRFLIPASSASIIMDFKDELEAYCMTQNWIALRTKSQAIIVIVVLKMEYPEVTHLFEVEGSEIVLPQELRDVAKSIEFMTDGDVSFDRQIEIKLGKNEITVKAQRSGGSITKIVDSAFDGGGVSFFITPQFLYEILDNLQANNTIRTVLGESVLLFQMLAGETVKFQHIASLAEA